MRIYRVSKADRSYCVDDDFRHNCDKYTYFAGADGYEIMHGLSMHPQPLRYEYKDISLDPVVGIGLSDIAPLAAQDWDNLQLLATEAESELSARAKAAGWGL